MVSSIVCFLSILNIRRRGGLTALPSCDLLEMGNGGGYTNTITVSKRIEGRLQCD